MPLHVRAVRVPSCSASLADAGRVGPTPEGITYCCAIALARLRTHELAGISSLPVVKPAGTVKDRLYFGGDAEAAKESSDAPGTTR